jgi:hypothetical protein
MAIGHCGDSENGSDDSGQTDDEQRPPRKLVVLAKAKKEGRRLLTEQQYWDMVGYVERLCEFGDRTATADLDIKPFRKFWEFRVKGGFIRNINLRIYFAYIEDRNEVVILMTYKKEAEGIVPPHIHILLEDRLEDYLLGSNQGVSVYSRARQKPR